MNKTYQKPTTVVVRIEQHLMTSTSTVGVGNAYESGDAVLSRRSSSSWDDDEE